MKTLYRGYEILLPESPDAEAVASYSPIGSPVVNPIALQPVSPDNLPQTGGLYTWEVPYQKGVTIPVPVAAILLREGVFVSSESVFPHGPRGSTAPDIHVITSDDALAPSFKTTFLDADELLIGCHHSSAMLATNQHGQVIGLNARSMNHPLFVINPAITAAPLPQTLPLRMGWERHPDLPTQERLVVFDQNTLEIAWPRDRAIPVGESPRWARNAPTVTVAEIPFDERALMKFGGLRALADTVTWARKAYTADMLWLDDIIARQVNGTDLNVGLFGDTMAIALTELHALNDRCALRPNGSEERAVLQEHAKRLLWPLINQGELGRLNSRASILDQLRIDSSKMAELIDQRLLPVTPRWPSPQMLSLSVQVPDGVNADAPAFIRDLLAVTHRTLSTGGFSPNHEIREAEGFDVYLDDYDAVATLRLTAGERLNTVSDVMADCRQSDGHQIVKIQIPAPYIGGPAMPSLCQVLAEADLTPTPLANVIERIQAAATRRHEQQPIPAEPVFSAEALGEKTRQLDALSRQLLANTAAGVRDLDVLTAHERARNEILGITTTQNIRLDYETFDVDMRAQQMAIGQAKVTQIVWDMGGLLSDWEASKGSVSPWTYARWLPAFGGDSVAIGVSAGGVVQVNGDPFCRALPSGIVTLNIDSNVIRASMVNALSPALDKSAQAELQPHIVLYRENDNAMLADPPLAFACQAEDADHAEEQALDAYPGVSVAWVYQGDSPERAYEDFFTAGDPEKQSLYVITVSREVITPESAAEGSYDSLETTIDAEPYNFDELERLVRELGINEASSSRPEPGAWFRSSSPEHNRAYFEKDEQAFYSLFVKSINGRPLEEEDLQRLANALDIRFSQPLNLNADKTASPSSATPAP